MGQIFVLHDASGKLHAHAVDWLGVGKDDLKEEPPELLRESRPASGGAVLSEILFDRCQISPRWTGVAQTPAMSIRGETL